MSCRNALLWATFTSIALGRLRCRDSQFATSVTRFSATIWQSRNANATGFPKRVHSSSASGVSASSRAPNRPARGVGVHLRLIVWCRVEAFPTNCDASFDRPEGPTVNSQGRESLERSPQHITSPAGATVWFRRPKRAERWVLLTVVFCRPFRAPRWGGR